MRRRSPVLHEDAVRRFEFRPDQLWPPSTTLPSCADQRSSRPRSRPWRRQSSSLRHLSRTARSGAAAEGRSGRGSRCLAEPRRAALTASPWRPGCLVGSGSQSLERAGRKRASTGAFPPRPLDSNQPDAKRGEDGACIAELIEPVLRDPVDADSDNNPLVRRLRRLPGHSVARDN
jgi:hypothetical protein